MMKMRRLTTLLTVLTFAGFMLAACSGDSGTGPDPGNETDENNGGSQSTTYTVDVSAADGGSVSPSGSNEYDDGETAELTADPNDEYVFSGWTGDVESEENPLSLTVDQNYSLTANFEIKNYELTTHTEGEGAVSESVIQKKTTDYDSGTVVELRANPGEGYKFVEWQGDMTGSENPRQITVDNPKEVTAVFEKKSYELTVNTQGEGAVSEEIVQAKAYDHGTVVKLDANAATGWGFAEWQGDLTETANSQQITIDEPKEVTAVFEQKLFYLASNGVTIKCENASEGDTGTVDGVTYTKRSAGQITTDNAPTTCTSGITDMSSLFSLAGSFNGDISHWDVSSVTNMNGMFDRANAFNGNISSWDVSSVTDMGYMFYEAFSFNNDLSSWDVSEVTNMEGMFDDAESFNGDISSWDVSSVTNMSRMFSGASAFNSDLSSWDVSGVGDMSRMFNGADSFNSDLSSWDVFSVTDMNAMFSGADAFNSDLNNWNVSSVTNMEDMFRFATSFNGDISSWDVSSVTNMSRMFNGADSFNSDLSSWDVSAVTNVEDMAGMFNDASSFNQDISDWPVPGICSKPVDFDIGTHEDFENNANKQPNWSDTCK